MLLQFPCGAWLYFVSGETYCRGRLVGVWWRTVSVLLRVGSLFFSISDCKERILVAGWYADLVRGTKTASAAGCSESCCPVIRCRQTCWELWRLAWSMLSGGLPRAVGTDKLHKFLQGVLSRVVVVADGWVGEVGARLLDDGGRREVQGRG